MNDDVEAARRIRDAFTARDIDAIVEEVGEDCEVVALRSEMKGTVAGQDGVRRWVEAFIRAVPDAEEIRARVYPVHQDRALAVGAAHTGGDSFGGPLGLTLEIRGGKVTRLTAAPQELRRAAAPKERKAARKARARSRKPTLVNVMTVAVLIALVVVGYFVGPEVPVFVAAVIGLPMAGWLLNRAPHRRRDS